jgi:glycine/D-amino acid oxidase-like deaminating enzyme/nitrite reductase/ring-hydroxylating ferredoxin subunit
VPLPEALEQELAVLVFEVLDHIDEQERPGHPLSLPERSRGFRSRFPRGSPGKSETVGSDFSPSLWLTTAAETDFPRLDGRVLVDVAIVGGGIVGVTTGALLKEAGKTVAVVEMGRIGQGTTGFTTAKLTVGHGLVYKDLLSVHGQEAARLYAESNQAAIALAREQVRRLDIDCDWESASNYLYTESPKHVGDLREELEAAVAAGVDATLTSETDLPFAIAAAVRVDNQAQFHPLKYLQGLATHIPGEGSHVFEQSRATGLRSGRLHTVETTAGAVQARHVVVATQLPFLDRGLFFALAHPVKSYVVAAGIEEARAPRGMYISADGPTRSIRSAPGPDASRYLIVAGETGPPGQDSAERYEALERFLRELFGADAEDRWSAHDFMPVDGLPYVGRLRRRDDRVYVATGFAKWGLTKGTAAAALLTDTILGRPNRWAGLYDAKRVKPRASARKLVTGNGKVALHFFGDRLRPRPGEEELDRLAPGNGTIVRIGGRHYAVYRADSEELQVLSARCTHLGCLVRWNSADRAWECPCHGSRFAADGTLVQGPATRDLERRSLPRGMSPPAADRIKSP